MTAARLAIALSILASCIAGAEAGVRVIPVQLSGGAGGGTGTTAPAPLPLPSPSPQGNPAGVGGGSGGTTGTLPLPCSPGLLGCSSESVPTIQNNPSSTSTTQDQSGAAAGATSGTSGSAAVSCPPGSTSCSSGPSGGAAPGAPATGSSPPAGAAQGGAAGQATPPQPGGGGGGGGAGTRGVIVDLTVEQRAALRQLIDSEHTPPVKNANVTITLGTAVPQEVPLEPLPSTAATIAPALAGKMYFVAADQRIVIVDNNTRQISAVIARA